MIQPLISKSKLDQSWAFCYFPWGGEGRAGVAGTQLPASLCLGPSLAGESKGLVDVTSIWPGTK